MVDVMSGEKSTTVWNDFRPELFLPSLPPTLFPLSGSSGETATDDNNQRSSLASSKHQNVSDMNSSRRPASLHPPKKLILSNSDSMLSSSSKCSTAENMFSNGDKYGCRNDTDPNSSHLYQDDIFFAPNRIKSTTFEGMDHFRPSCSFETGVKRKEIFGNNDPKSTHRFRKYSTGIFDSITSSSTTSDSLVLTDNEDELSYTTCLNNSPDLWSTNSMASFENSPSPTIAAVGDLATDEEGYNSEHFFDGLDESFHSLESNFESPLCQVTYNDSYHHSNVGVEDGNSNENRIFLLGQCSKSCSSNPPNVTMNHSSTDSEFLLSKSMPPNIENVKVERFADQIFPTVGRSGYSGADVFKRSLSVPNLNLIERALLSSQLTLDDLRKNGLGEQLIRKLSKLKLNLESSPPPSAPKHVAPLNDLELDEVDGCLTKEKSIRMVTIDPESDEEDGDDNCKKLQRSSSLKSGNSPVTRANKIVRFADVFGLELADVKTFFDDIPRIPRSAYNDLKEVDLTIYGPDSFTHGGKPIPPPPSWSEDSEFLFMRHNNVKNKQSNVNRQCIYTIVPMFIQPDSRFDFYDKVNNHKVCLENTAMTMKNLLRGVVRVQNISFEKKVVIRYTTNEWISTCEVECEYVTGSCDGFSDKFQFFISTSNMFVGQRLQLCIRYECSDGIQMSPITFWDNNSGQNYIFQCCKESNCRVTNNIFLDQKVGNGENKTISRHQQQQRGVVLGAKTTKPGLLSKKLDSLSAAVPFDSVYNQHDFL